MACHDLETRLKEFDQEHLMRFYNTLDDDQQIKLSNELKNVDFKKIARLYTKAKEDLNKPAVSCLNFSLFNLNFSSFLVVVLYYRDCS